MFLVEVVVAGDYRCDDLGIILEHHPERVSRANSSLANFDRVIGGLFSPDSCEELVEEMNDFQLWLARHDPSPFNEIFFLFPLNVNSRTRSNAVEP